MKTGLSGYPAGIQPLGENSLIPVGVDGVAAWHKGAIAAYDAGNATSLANSYINIVDPGTFDLTAPTFAPTWASGTGWTFDGLTQWLATGVFFEENYSMVIQFSSRSGGGYTGANGTNRSSIRPSAVRYRNGGTGETINSPGISTGVLAICGNQAFRDGVNEGITLNPWVGSGANNSQIAIGALGELSPMMASSFLNADVQKFALYDSDVSSRMAGIYASMVAS